MPRLHHAPHEAFAKEYAKDLGKGKKVVATKVYKRIYANTSERSAEVNASRLLSSPIIQDRIQQIINLKNPAEAISQDLADLRQAKKQVFDPEGNLIEVKDNATRLGAVNTCVKVLGGFGQENNSIDARSVTFNMNNGQSVLFDSMYKKLESLCSGIMSVGQSSPEAHNTNMTQEPLATEEKSPH